MPQSKKSDKSTNTLRKDGDMAVKKTYILGTLIFLSITMGGLVLLIGLRKEATPLVTPATTELRQDQNGNFILYVSNQSGAVDPVDIKIFIDGEVAVEQDFHQAGGHNWQKFQFSLSQGNHAIYAMSIKGEAKLEKEFEIKDKHWVVVDYGYSPLSKPCSSNYCGELTPRHFSFYMRDEPIYFE